MCDETRAKGADGKTVKPVGEKKNRGQEMQEPERDSRGC